MGSAQNVARLVPFLCLVTVACQNDVDVPPPPEGMTGIITPPTPPTASATPGGRGSGAGPSGGADGEGPPLPNAPNNDAGSVPLGGGSVEFPDGTVVIGVGDAGF